MFQFGAGDAFNSTLHFIRHQFARTQPWVAPRDRVLYPSLQDGICLKENSYTYAAPFCYGIIYLQYQLPVL
jgi:hypothetical protein